MSDSSGNPLQMRREVYEAHAYITEHFREHLTWKVVGDKVGLSGNYLRGLYGQVYNDSLKNTIMKCRMKYAASLLVMTKWTIKDIGNETQYQDTAYFCKLFKEWSGMTPMEFRKKYTFFPENY